MSDEEDYMSDAFLATLEDVRPGLKRSHATQREHKLLKKKIEECQSKKPKSSQLEVEKREEGLQKSLDSTNKGFALLAKMGYKAGESLGKSGKSGRLEPIPIEVKNNRSGLGRDAAIQHIKETKAKLKSMQQKSNPTTSTAEFRASQSLKVRSKRVESDLFNSQKACRQLDLGKDFTEPVEAWFWPKAIVVEDNDEEEAKIREIDEDESEEEVEIPPEEMLKILTEYLRAEYLFCIWCGITFKDAEDLNNSCPGNDRDSHDE